MKYWLSLLFEPTSALLDHARMAEELGFEGVVLPDHVVIKDGPRTPHPSNYPLQATECFIDPLLAYSAMAAVTTRLRFLSYVYVIPLRDPFMLAKQVGSLAVLSNNRAVLGTGVGWLKEEFEAVGKDFHTRGKRLDEMLAIMRDFWDDGYAEFHSEHYDFPRSGMFPVPEAPIPIWIGGHSMAAARRSAAYEGYMPMRRLREMSGALDEQTAAEFREIDALRRERGITARQDRLMMTAFPLDDPGVSRKLEASGITQTIVEPWPLNDKTSTLDQKRRLAEMFAEKVIART